MPVLNYWLFENWLYRRMLSRLLMSSSCVIVSENNEQRKQRATKVTTAVKTAKMPSFREAFLNSERNRRNGLIRFVIARPRFFGDRWDECSTPSQCLKSGNWNDERTLKPSFPTPKLRSWKLCTIHCFRAKFQFSSGCPKRCNWNWRAQGLERKRLGDQSSRGEGYRIAESTSKNERPRVQRSKLHRKIRKRKAKRTVFRKETWFLFA